MNPLDELYQQVILEHARRPQNHGPQPVPPAFRAEGVNPSCGDEIEVWVSFAPDGTIQKVSFDGQGCAISQSAASVMTLKMAGLSPEAARRLINLHGGNADIHYESIDTPHTRRRKQCLHITKASA